MCEALNFNWRLTCTLAGLYLIEGVPISLTDEYIPFHLSKVNVTATEMGDLQWWGDLPWSWKWLWSPLLDQGMSKRKVLLGSQVIMIFFLMLVPLTSLKEPGQGMRQLLFCHNFFAATHDMAIDAIGVEELLAAGGAASANSFMFAAGSVGSWLGLLAFRGSSLGLGFAGGLWATLGALGVFVVFLAPLVPAPAPAAAPAATPGGQSPRWGRFACVALHALLPSGALFVGSSHFTAWMEQSGLDEAAVADVGASEAMSICACLLGGFLGDRLGARLVLALSFAATAAVSWGLALCAPTSREAFLVAASCYKLGNGLHLGAQMGLFMSCCSRWPATQFTLLCSLCNFSESYWVYWYGEYLDSVERDRAGLLWWDGWLGLVGLLPLAFLRQERPHAD
ncbi:unnamed protein product [Effrenium voratum]|nr:unnamed protein product [Effrenium voratum]